ncbi:hypothetical protein [Tahibacter soli]|uniref:Uncharacterized protein n=1 Tax=Tahibacter soli TaxID=2983605 RepID=A0A9X3YKT5_9GAMM|nr:hypothetical protein [Tahibacter soli]MDC8013459.1 hypothetical protein [Tahibacter soli]
MLTIGIAAFAADAKMPEIDAYAAIEAQLPDNRRAEPPDEAAIAACVARSDAEE